jgi:chaperone modulatory protein CbpM
MNPVQPWPIEAESSIGAATLCRSLGCEFELIVGLVEEGVVEPLGESTDSWRFAGTALQRASRALRLARDLEINPPGVALAMLLLDEIGRLESDLSAHKIAAVGLDGSDGPPCRHY